MHHRIEIPDTLGRAFHIRDAAAQGVGRGRCAARDLHRPFPGIRSIALATTFQERARSYAPRLGDTRYFATRTAGRLLGLPLPWLWNSDELLQVAVLGDAAPPRVAGVQGLRIHPRRVVTTRVDGIPVFDAVTTMFQLAPELTARATVILLEAMFTASESYPALLETRPLSDPAAVEERLEQWGRFAGVQRIRTALKHARVGVESPKETETRLTILAAGMPEPEIQYVVRERGRRIAKVDLAYPHLKIAIAYEGDGHRTDREQWREDIRRQRELEECGWLVIRITQLDLAAGRAAFLARLRRAISTRSSR